MKRAQWSLLYGLIVAAAAAVAKRHDHLRYISISPLAVDPSPVAFPTDHRITDQRITDGPASALRLPDHELPAIRVLAPAADRNGANVTSDEAPDNPNSFVSYMEMGWPLVVGSVLLVMLLCAFRESFGALCCPCLAVLRTRRVELAMNRRTGRPEVVVRTQVVRMDWSRLFSRGDHVHRRPQGDLVVEEHVV